MTTAVPPTRTAFFATVPLGLVAVVVAALVGGGPAVAGAAIGAAMVWVFFGSGALVLGVVARAMPAASLLISLLTYTLQVALMGLVFVALKESGALGSTVHPAWLAGTVIAGTMLWLAAQTTAHVRTRQPLYDLPAGQEQASAR